MYMFPKFLESIQLNAVKLKRDHLINFKFGHNMMFGFALGVTSYVYNLHPDAVKKSIAFILDLIIGKDQNSNKKSEMLVKSTTLDKVDMKEGSQEKTLSKVSPESNMGEFKDN